MRFWQNVREKSYNTEMVGPSAGQVSVKYFTAFLLVVWLAFPLRIWVPLGPFASFSPMDVVLLLGLFCLLVHALSGGALRLGYPQVAAALAIPVFFCFLSFSWTVELTQTIKAALTYTEALAAFLVTIAVFEGMSSKAIAHLLGFFVTAITFTAFLSEIGFPGLAPQIPPNLAAGTPGYNAFVLSYHARLSHPFIGFSNNLATVLAFFPIIFSAYAKVSKRNLFNWLAVLCTLAIVLTLSRGVILALAIGYLLYGLGHRVSLKQLWISGWVLALIVAGFLVFIRANPVMRHHLADRLSMSNIGQRLETWRTAWTALTARPFLGYGAGVAVFKTQDMVLEDPHNAFLAQMFYFGVPGGFLVSLSILLIPLLFLLWRFSSAEACLMRKGVVFSLVAQMIVFSSQASFEGSVLRVLFYFSVGASVTFLGALERENAACVS